MSLRPTPTPAKGQTMGFVAQHMPVVAPAAVTATPFASPIKFGVTHADRLAALQSYIPKKNVAPTPTEYTMWDQYNQAESAAKAYFGSYPDYLTLGKFIRDLTGLRRSFVGLQGDKGQMLEGKFTAQIEQLDSQLSNILSSGGADPVVPESYFSMIGNTILKELAAAKEENLKIMGGSKWEGGY